MNRIHHTSDVEPAARIDFPYLSIIETTNALTTIIDYNEDTLSFQKKNKIDSRRAKSLLRPLHSLWDEKLTQLSLEILGWEKSKIHSVLSKCDLNCSCSFYSALLDKKPQILNLINSTIEKKIQQSVPSKADLLRCLHSSGSFDLVIKFLESQLHLYEADSIL